MGYTPHLLDTQYRMHPSISQFPNMKFYDKRIFDGENVCRNEYNKTYLPGIIHHPYSFIDIKGLERPAESSINMVEVAAVTHIIEKLGEGISRLSNRMLKALSNLFASCLMDLMDFLWS